MKFERYFFVSLSIGKVTCTHTHAFCHTYNANRDANLAARARELPCTFLLWYHNSFPIYRILLREHVNCPAHFSHAHGTTTAFPASSFNFFHWQVFLISSKGIIWGPSKILNTFCPHCSQISTHVNKCSSHST